MSQYDICVLQSDKNTRTSCYISLLFRPTILCTVRPELKHLTAHWQNDGHDNDGWKHAEVTTEFFVLVKVTVRLKYQEQRGRSLRRTVTMKSNVPPVCIYTLQQYALCEEVSMHLVSPTEGPPNPQGTSSRFHKTYWPKIDCSTDVTCSFFSKERTLNVWNSYFIKNVGQRWYSETSWDRNMQKYRRQRQVEVVSISVSCSCSLESWHVWRDDSERITTRTTEVRRVWTFGSSLLFFFFSSVRWIITWRYIVISVRTHWRLSVTFNLSLGVKWTV